MSAELCRELAEARPPTAGPPMTRSLLLRWIKFNIVGGAGIVVQSAMLALLVRVIGLNYLAATALAVEAAVIHNFIWHQRWTWSDRMCRLPMRSRAGTLRTLIRFNLTAGAVSIAGNLLFMRLLVGETGIGVTKSNLLTIAICSLANFVLSDRVVFRRNTSNSPTSDTRPA
jgi:putative flippase GtrA